MSETRIKFLEREVARLSNMIDRDAQRPRGPVLKNRFTPWGVWQGDAIGANNWDFNINVGSSSDAMFTSVQTGGSPNRWGCRVNLDGWYRVSIELTSTSTAGATWSGSAVAPVTSGFGVSVSVGGSPICGLVAYWIEVGQLPTIYHPGGFHGDGIGFLSSGQIVHVPSITTVSSSITLYSRLTIERIG